MSSNDHSVDSLKPQNVRLRHMFQTEDTSDRFQLPDELNEEDLNRIVLHFGTNDHKDTTLVDSFHKLIELSNNTPTTSLLSFIDELKEQYSKSDEGLDEHMDIAKLIQQSEAELLQEKDQKTILYDLIRDINKVTAATNASDEEFEQNLEEILDEAEVIDEDGQATMEEAIDLVKKQEVNESPDEMKDKEENTKGKKSLSGRETFLILFVFVGLLFIIYLYREQIFAIFS